MGVNFSTRRIMLGGVGGYRERVLATGPIAYWMQAELTGTVSYCQVDPAQNGAYTGVTLGQPGIGDGRTSGLFDGALDYNDIGSASLYAGFNGIEGAALGWARVANAGVWTDGANRYLFHFRPNAANRIYCIKIAANNSLQWTYTAGGVSESFIQGGVTTTDWFSVGMKWSKPAERVDYYLNGVPIAFDINLGIWSGALAAQRAVIGAASTVPANPYDGWEAHWIFWDRVPSDAEMLSVGVL